MRLNKKKKSTNTFPYPDEAIERLARAFYPAILACWNSEEGQRSLVGARPLHLVNAAYKLLNLETYFTAGVQEVRAWTYEKGWKAPQCAGVIHTDFEKGFIRAEVIKYDDYIQYGSEAAVKEAGKLGVEGKEYVVQDGDIMHFRFNV